MRRATGYGQIRMNRKARFAGALRPRQFQVEGGARQAANTTLEETLRLESLWTEEWENSDRTADELRLAALAELETYGTPNAVCRELVHAFDLLGERL
jgi:hypothetical protein